MKRNLALAVLVSGAIALSACGKKHAPDSASSLPPPGGQAQSGYGEYDPDGPGSQADLRRTAGSDRVFFDLDSYALDATDQATLRRQASWLAQYPNVNVTLEGHCDERGTRDYNIALGERRANAAKNFLATLGVAPARMNVVSYGKERPEALGSTEEAWAQNRRAVTVVIR
ncbi:outer membrane lipoprotein Omp16 [Novosphingobium indicum]|uniref:Peptidoglycan-associated lipoprotein n=1 Tax=Novosphingobium indicum TaxID=462949 RepID=A0ABQ2JZQ2_9SPHN|nr:peptidoglycan-associated lipoprotein Pal [Novosphingobium indicum]GGN62113.1 outer membrane lipoprotein Omp16 [Novosphingobium indicum]